MTRWPEDAAVRVEQGDDQLPGQTAGVGLADMDDPAAELAAYFQTRTPVPDDELIRLPSAARGAGHSWANIAAACQVRRRRDTEGVVTGADGRTPHRVPGCYTKPPRAPWNGSWAVAAIRR
jgi:hypothetical protein